MSKGSMYFLYKDGEVYPIWEKKNYRPSLAPKQNYHGFTEVEHYTLNGLENQMVNRILDDWVEFWKDSPFLNIYVERTMSGIKFWFTRYLGESANTNVFSGSFVVLDTATNFKVSSRCIQLLTEIITTSVVNRQQEFAFNDIFENHTNLEKEDIDPGDPEDIIPKVIYDFLNTYGKMIRNDVFQYYRFNILPFSINTLICIADFDEEVYKSTKFQKLLTPKYDFFHTFNVSERNKLMNCCCDILCNRAEVNYAV